MKTKCRRIVTFFISMSRHVPKYRDHAARHGSSRGLLAGCTLVLTCCLAPLLPLAEANDADRISPIDIRQVKVEGPIGRRIDATVKNNLLVLDINQDYVQPFRDRNQQGGFIGAGMLVDSIVRFAAYTGDEKVLALKRHVVTELIKTQEPDGYIGLMVPESRMWELWDVHEMSYLVLGLSADHQFFGEEKSLQAARNLADYIIRRWVAEPEKQLGAGMISDHMAATGIGSAMLALHQQTGDARYLDFCTKTLHIPDWDYPIVVGRHGRIGGHAYAYMSRCLVQLRIHQLQPDKKLFSQSRKALDFLIQEDGLAITGTCGDFECWHDTQAGTHGLGETCATAYLIRWLDNLLLLEVDPRYGDIIERAIHNGLFAAQSPDGRNIRYYSPFDGPREYFAKDTYCCPSNYRRIVAELPGLIYYRWGEGVMINLITPSSTTIKLDEEVSLDLRQETDYPSSGKVLIHVSPREPATFPLKVRIPGWCSEAKIIVNGKQHGVSAAGYYTVEREWRSGDRVELDLPMEWRLVKGRKAQAGRVAVMRGPLVFCLSRARHPELANADLRLITLDPSSLEGPVNDDTVRPGGLACKVRAWGPGVLYPFSKAGLRLTLTEYPDPDGELVYFHVPNPKAEQFVEDELCQK
ncbi:MAG: hypothetical protein GXP26_10720 [Planctomycetes bacterium]|nr:hypothetical protein [Planctomycetota bacterium]